TLNNVRSMIGYFDLDPNRVLDILLDVFANSLVPNHRFFVQLLKESEWWPSSTPLDKNDMEEDRKERDGRLFDRLQREGISALISDPDGSDLLATRGGNKVAAQLIGFKFRYYTQPDIDPVKYPTPENLSALAALLIKIG